VHSFIQRNTLQNIAMVSMVKTRAERKEGEIEGGQTEGSHGERKPTFSECWRFIDDLKAHVEFTDDKEEQFSFCGWHLSGLRLGL